MSQPENPAVALLNAFLAGDFDREIDLRVEHRLTSRDALMAYIDTFSDGDAVEFLILLDAVKNCIGRVR